MANVKIDTENLKAGGQYISKSLSENENNYSSVKSINGSPCTSLENFKESLNTRFTNYSDHSSIASEKINECADSLEQIDTFIGSNVTNLLNSDMDLFATEDDAKLALTSLNDEGYVNPYDPENLPDITLYDSDTSVLTFTQNGKAVYETYCNSPLKYSLDLKFLILKLGYDPGFWYRADGVQMLGKDVMYGGDIPGWGPKSIEQDDAKYNVTNSTRRRGDKFYGTSGPGRIVGVGGTSKDAHLGEFVRNGKKYDETYDVYTAWGFDKDSEIIDVAEYNEYTKRHKNKEEQYATRNVINNPPAPNSERYYQTNESWVKMFNDYPLTREYIPSGVVDWSSDEWRSFDWASYFQKNNPESDKKI